MARELRYPSRQVNSTIDPLRYQNLDGDNKPRNITGATSLVFRMVNSSDVETTNATPVIDDAVNGTLSYTLQSADVTTAGTYRCQFEFTLNALKHVSPPITMVLVANP